MTDLTKEDLIAFEDEVAARFNAAQIRAPIHLYSENEDQMIEIFKDGIARYGARAQSDDIIRRLEEATGADIRAPGFPPEMLDDEPEEPGYEVIPMRG